MRTVKILRVMAMVLLALMLMTLVACGEEAEGLDSDSETTVTVFLRDRNSGAHKQLDVKISRLELADVVLLAQLQDKGERITVDIPKDIAEMSEEEQLALVQAALQAYRAEVNQSPEDPDPNAPNQDPNEDPNKDPNEDPNKDPNEDPNEDPSEDPSEDPVKPDSMKEPVTLTLKDPDSQKNYTFTFDLAGMEAVNKALVLESKDETIEIGVAKDPKDMTEAQKNGLIQAIIELLSYVPPNPPAPHATVFVDAGHGFTNSYGVPDRGTGDGSPYYNLTGKYESDLNLMIAMHLRDQLVAAGFDVIMSRESEVNSHLTVNDRVRMINASGADILISVHANAASAAAKGARVYWNRNNDSPAVSESYAEMVVDAINEIGGVTNKEAYADEGNYAVVRDVHIPAVLVETCFLTNEEDAQMASDPKFAMRMAQALCNGICKQFIGA